MAMNSRVPLRKAGIIFHKKMYDNSEWKVITCGQALTLDPVRVEHLIALITFQCFSNPADTQSTQNVSCLGLCGRDIFPEKLCLIWAGCFQSSVVSVTVSI